MNSEARKKLIAGCIAENNPKYLAQALRLLQSIRWFGGRLADVDFVVGVIEGIHQGFAKEFSRWGASVQVVPRYSPLHAPSNKLRFFDIIENRDYETSVLLDCDTVVVQDPTEHISGRKFQAKIADCATMPHALFEKLFNFFQLKMPEQKYLSTSTREATILYCNAGVLIMPREIVSRLLPRWRFYNDQLLNNMELLGHNNFFCEQASLTLALVETEVDFKPLPLAMNFPVHHPQSIVAEDMYAIDPVIIHYHHLVNASGFLKDSYFPKAQQRIKQFNDRLRQERRRHFNNQLFWEERYYSFPELGSGLGSRGDCLAYKKKIIAEHFSPFSRHSILDIGCGDSQVTEDIDFSNYLGLDLSAEAIKKNQEKFPQRQYVAGNFLDLTIARFDVSLCLDVVIHIADAEQYRCFLKKIVEHTINWGMISGYEQNPKTASEITFFHEPLSQTLKGLGVKHVEIIGEYRDTALLKFVV